MKRAWVETSRAEEVRGAGRGWKSAGAIDAATLSAIQAAYPDPRIALHRAWRVLVFVLVSIVVGAVFFGTFHGAGGRLLVPSLVFAVALSAATEGLRGSKFSGTGADAATSFWAVVFLLVAVAFSVTEHLDLPRDLELTLLLLAAGIVGLLAAWRWGFWFFAGAGTAALYFCVGRLTAGRTAWMAVSILVIAFVYRRLDRASIAPAHRFGLAAVFAVSAAALYGAINLYSFDELLVERLRYSLFDGAEISRTGPTPLRLLAGFLTAVFPVFFLAWGIRARRSLLFGIGLASTALSAATLRHYFPIGPQWAFLTVCGAILVAAALWIHRRLRDAPGGVWRGLTAAPLYSGGEGGVSPLSALGAHLVAPSPSHPPDSGGLSTGGGSYGGGGASGGY